MSALDNILKYDTVTPNIHEWGMWVKPARAELAALRAKADERDAFANKFGGGNIVSAMANCIGWRSNSDVLYCMEGHGGTPLTRIIDDDGNDKSYCPECALETAQECIAEQARQLEEGDTELKSAVKLFLNAIDVLPWCNDITGAWVSLPSDVWKEWNYGACEMLRLAANAPHYLTPDEIEAAVTEAHQSEARADDLLAANASEQEQP
jgi:hypothetical protein